MGTNYFARIIPTKKRKKELCNLINNSMDFNKIQEEISNTYGSIQYSSDMKEGNYGEVHLGKRSAGWKFLWNPNIYEIRNGHTVPEEIEPGVTRFNWVDDPLTSEYIYPLTKKGIKEFIDRADIEVWNEYGEKQDKEEFFNMAVNWITWTDHNTGKEKEAWDGKSYELWEQEQNPSRKNLNYRTEYCDFLTDLGYNIEWPYTDFYSDGLRFSTNTSFS